jgi:hypothetical protein
MDEYEKAINRYHTGTGDINPHSMVMAARV